MAELAQSMVARVSFGSSFMRATLAHLQRIISDLFKDGTYTTMTEHMLSAAELRSLFA